MVSDCLVTSIDEAPRVKASTFNELRHSRVSSLFPTTYRITRNREAARRGRIAGSTPQCLPSPPDLRRQTKLSVVAHTHGDQFRADDRSQKPVQLQVSLDDTGDRGDRPAVVGRAFPCI